ncbi:MAG TPA: magnesium transporter CorA family protein [Rhizomicrobium sp.]|jgi:magnesium transporter|nr:magnesium transporter CorA family protein [Rhizomicrobium sp.]
MLKVYQQQNGGLRGTILSNSDPVPPGAIWFDLFDPSTEERLRINALLGVEMPTRADMEEIEVSSRLYQENDGIFLTALILSNAETETPMADVVSFVLTHDKLITIRYVDPQPFKTFAARCERGSSVAPRADMVLMALLDVIIDRMADILERAGAEIEVVSRDIFQPAGGQPMQSRDFQTVLRRLGRKHDLMGKMRESLLSFSRVLSFLTPAMEGKSNKDVRTHIKTLTRDVQSLQDHTSFLSGKLNYLLDATLGLINIDQNNIIKIMSVAAIVFLPPTLFASIWGMNFHFMPELSEEVGYPLALVIIVISGILPYAWFKRRGWL